MTSILCLAHYCDLHGPTPLMVTEGLPVPCSSCYEHQLPDYGGAGGDRPHTSGQSALSTAQATAAITEALRRMNLAGAHRSNSMSISEQDEQAHRAALRRAPQMATASTSAGGTPPTSPRRVLDRRPSDNSVSSVQPRRDSSFRRTYDDSVTKRAGPCDNCAMTLPRRQEAKGPGKSAADARSPTLRTRAPYQRIYGGDDGDESPPASQTASSSDTDGDEKPRIYTHRRTGTITSMTSRSSTSSMSRRSSHTHYLDYTSTHEPVVANSYSVIRASCLRTLSFEMLPRNSAPGSSGSSNATPLVSPQTPSFVTTHSAGAVASGGPIFFGDPMAGYTTAYIFRIPDLHARGHKRVYAFLALSTHRERLAMKTFGFMSAAFHELATWVQQLAEAEAERALSDSSSASSPVAAHAGLGGSAAFGNATSFPPPPDTHGGGSSFLAAAGGGLARRMGGGFGGAGNALRARGLPELVGLPDFFIELHSRFVRLLLELGVMLNA